MSAFAQPAYTQMSVEEVLAQNNEVSVHEQLGPSLPLFPPASLEVFSLY